MEMGRSFLETETNRRKDDSKEKRTIFERKAYVLSIKCLEESMFAF